MTRSSGAPPRPSSPLQGEEDATAGCDDADVRAMTVAPGQKGTAGIEEVPGPDMQDGALLVRGMAVGVCGTDREIAEGAYGTPPPGEARLIIGHESLGEVLEARWTGSRKTSKSW
jgi:threonine dehydrogenase-like Zn-dependent dehydrogenase